MQSTLHAGVVGCERGQRFVVITWSVTGVEVAATWLTHETSALKEPGWQQSEVVGTTVRLNN